jgi:hypothetical protein
MMTSAQTSFPRLFTEIDQLSRADHWHLDESDICWFLGEYTVRGTYKHGPTNALIWNFKKPMSKKGLPEWYYKSKAIMAAAAAVSHALKSVDTKGCTFVPIPPSAVKGSSEYDDRVVQMLRAIRPAVDARELVVQNTSRPPAHLSDGKRKPEEHVARYNVVETLAAPSPTTLIICDDTIRTGCQFKAMKTVLKAHFPDARIQGMFLARCLPDTDTSVFDLDF